MNNVDFNMFVVHNEDLYEKQKTGVTQVLKESSASSKIKTLFLNTVIETLNEKKNNYEDIK